MNVPHPSLRPSGSPPKKTRSAAEAANRAFKAHLLLTIRRCSEGDKKCLLNRLLLNASMVDGEANAVFWRRAVEGILDGSVVDLASLGKRLAILKIMDPDVRRACDAQDAWLHQPPVTPERFAGGSRRPRPGDNVRAF